MVNKKFKVKSRDKQSKTTGVRHSDDDVKKAVVDRIGQLFIIILLVSLESLNLFPDFPKCCVKF